MRRIILVCIALLFSSCTTAPRVDNYPYSAQEKMQSVLHWETLAKQVVGTEIIPALGGTNQTLSPVYVDQSDQTQFGKAFYNYIITELVNHRVVLSPTPQGATVVKWGTQLVWHNQPWWPPGIILGTGEFLAWFFGGSSWISPPTGLELIVITQVEHGNIILSRQSRNYYISEPDKMNFHVAKKK
jgi:hypothetical protein